MRIKDTNFTVLNKEKQIQLGKKLFYEPRLSKDNMISCASCHSPFQAFAHNDHDLSHGIFDSIGKRNAPALFNLRWHKSFMWDGAINHLDMQALAPIHSPTEMGSSIQEIIEKLQKDTNYSELFRLSYGDSVITSQGILKALSAFQLTLVSANSKYDKVLKGIDSFTIQEQNGYKLFQHHCNACHTEPHFTNYEFANNGLKIDTSLLDIGRMNITHLSSDSLCFKIPSLRNLKYSFPYMHDGRFKTLYQVLHHYTKEIKQNSLIDKRLKEEINLSENEKIDLISFLITLSDEEFIRNPKFR